MEFAKIKEDYKKAIEDATEKVQVAEECYGLVDRYLRKLDEELHKFKMELEADNRGITEILEKQSLEMDTQNVSHLKENRLPKKLVRIVSSTLKEKQLPILFNKIEILQKIFLKSLFGLRLK